MAAGVPSSVSSLCALLSGLCAEWRVFGLDGRRADIDGVALSMADAEERSAAARRGLSELSKALKRASAEERLAQVGGVVRAYQEEINCLTRRAKGAETAYLTLYHALMQVRDPTSALQAAASSLSSSSALDSTLRTTRQRLAEYEAEFSLLKNQDASLRRLEGELREAERRAEGRVQAALLQREEQQRAEVEELTREAAEREAALQSALSEAHEQLRAAQRAAEAQEERHFTASEKADRQLREAEREVEAMRAEQERLTNDLLALQAKLAAAAEKERGREGGEGGKGSAADGLPGAGAALTLTSLEEALFALREAVAQREAERDEAVEQARREREAASERMAAMQSAIDTQSALIDALQAQQINLHSHRSPGGAAPQPPTATQNADTSPFTAVREEGEEGAAEVRWRSTTATAASPLSSTSPSPSPSTSSPLALDELQATVSRLQAELEQARAAAELREAEWTAVDSERRTGLSQQQSTIAQLEMDVQTLQTQLLNATRHRPPLSTTPHSAHAHASSPPTPLAAGSTSASTAAATETSTASPSAVDSTTASTSPSPPSTLARVGSSTSSRASPPLGLAAPSAASAAAAAACCSCSTLLSIVTGQRDRLRARVEVAEKASSDASLALLEVQQRCQQLHQDNLELYEKLQFVQDRGWKQPQQPSQGHSHSHSAATAGGALHLDMRAGAASSASSSSSERRYASLYAESVNPFTAFKARALRESERALPPSERVALSVARLVFSRKAARSFAFFYALLLHLLIFLVLYTHTIADHCPRHSD